MDLHKSNSSLSRAGFTMGLSALAFLSVGSIQAIDLIEEFDGTELDLAVWESTGPKSRSVDGGALTFSDDGGNWASGDISTNQRFFLPPPGETTTINWTLGPSSIVSSTGENRVIRYQVGIHSANETNPRREHWLNTTGGLWIDLDFFDSTVTDSASGIATTANDTKAPSTQGDNVGGVTLSNWNWQTENRVLSLQITETDYTWFDGENILITGTFADAGIDTEFGNGFRVLALGMNFDSGRGTTSFEKIEILNAVEPPSLLTNFETSRAMPFSGQELTLNWLVAADASVSLNQGIGDVSNVTTDGVGAFTFTAPMVTEATTVDYTLAASANGETLERTISIDVVPLLPLSTESFVEEFEDDFLNEEMWIKTGDQSFFVADGKLEWAADGSNWSHGEIESRQIYPIPTGANTTTITWVYGPSTVTVDNGDGTALRPLMGIFSGYEDETYSKQHWQNNEGGIWLDLTNMGESRPDGVSGSITIANNTKVRETNADTLAGVDIGDWNWQTENHEFSLVLSETGFTWFSGANELGGGLYADYGLDTELEPGFGIMAMAGNSSGGRGEMSFESISLDNGGVPFNPEIKVTNIIYDIGDETLSLSWTSRANAIYNIEVLDENGAWELALDEVDATGELTTTVLDSVTSPSGIYRVVEE